MDKEALELLKKLTDEEILNLFKGLTNDEKRKLQEDNGKLKIISNDLQLKIKNELMLDMETNINEPTLLKIIINRISEHEKEVKESKYQEMIDSNEAIDFNELSKIKPNEELMKDVEKDLLENPKLFLEVSDWLRSKLNISRVNKQYVIKVVSAYMETLVKH